MSHHHLHPNGARLPRTLTSSSTPVSLQSALSPSPPRTCLCPWWEAVSQERAQGAQVWPRATFSECVGVPADIIRIRLAPTVATYSTNTFPLTVCSGTIPPGSSTSLKIKTHFTNWDFTLRHSPNEEMQQSPTLPGGEGQGWRSPELLQRH